MAFQLIQIVNIGHLIKRLILSQGIKEKNFPEMSFFFVFAGWGLFGSITNT